MISKYVHEQKRYTQENLHDIFECSTVKAIAIIKKLKEYGVLKAVKATNEQKAMLDLVEEDIEIAEVEIGDNEYLYVFTFVGVISVTGCILKCYPKYISNEAPKIELKQIIKVLERYNAKKQIIRMYNESEEGGSINLLAVIVYLLHDYHENGLYNNTQDIIEKNGIGEIFWDKTINETFTFLSDNHPYYPELLTKKRVVDDSDYFKRLHECILSLFTNELREADLLDLFDIMPVELTYEDLDNFGDNEFILFRIEKELNIQYNTRKQLLLKAIYAYISNSSHLSSEDNFSMFGTNSFNLVWENVCAEVMNNQLQSALGSLELPVGLNNYYKETDTLISLIEKPNWVGTRTDGSSFTKIAKDTLIPDLISINTRAGICDFIIFDAKYYVIQLEANKVLKGQPGIGDIIKQYIYQLAYKKFVTLHGIAEVKNCFLMPTEKSEVINKGYTNMAMLDDLGLGQIKIRLLPASIMYEYYLNGNRMDISKLNL